MAVSIRLGTGSAFAANKIKLGTTSITKVYLGTTQIFPPSGAYTPSYDFSDNRNSQYLGEGSA